MIRPLAEWEKPVPLLVYSPKLWSHNWAVIAALTWNPKQMVGMTLNIEAQEPILHRDRQKKKTKVIRVPKTTRRRWGHETVIRAQNSSVSHRSAADKSSQGEAGRQTRHLNSDTGLQGDECEVVWSTLSALVAWIPRRYIEDSRQPCSQNPLLIL